MWCTCLLVIWIWIQWMNIVEKKENRLVESLTLKCAGNGSIVPRTTHPTYLSHAILSFPIFFFFFSVISCAIPRCSVSCACTDTVNAVCWGIGTWGGKRKKKISFSYGWYFTAASTFAFHTHYVNFSHFSPIQSAYTRRMFLVSTSFSSYYTMSLLLVSFVQYTP